MNAMVPIKPVAALGDEFRVAMVAVTDEVMDLLAKGDVSGAQQYLGEVARVTSPEVRVAALKMISRRTGVPYEMYFPH